MNKQNRIWKSNEQPHMFMQFFLISSYYIKFNSEKKVIIEICVKKAIIEKMFCVSN